MLFSTSLYSAVLVLSAASVSGPEDFTNGPAIDDYGMAAEVAGATSLPAGIEFHVSFDTATGSEAGVLNPTLRSAARFINMHARAGIDSNRIEVAVVVHGKAVHDVSGEASHSAGLVAALIDHGVSIIVCGQSAAYYDIATSDLLPGVEMALSAMTAHALLQQLGYTLNPF